jgi:aminopeptidase N
MKNLSLLLFLYIISISINAQPLSNKPDSLRGSLNENRDWFDVKYYTLHINPNLEAHSLDESFVSWDCQVLKPYQKIQIDLQQPLIIDSIYFSVVTKMNGYYSNKGYSKKINFKREGNIAIANIDTTLKKGDYFSISIRYHGKPREAVRPPWDGGWIWKKDSNGKPWVSVACQGLGASVWYPCKDIQSDEPDDGVRIFLKTFEGLESISNGRSVLEEEGANRMGDWMVNSPINNYNIIPYIGDYVGWSEKYKGLKGDLAINYWVLREDSAKARKQFTQVPEMIKAFEYWFGPYPFYEDGFKMVQSPHLGMEHQSAIAYGNKFANGYLGRDLSGSGWGLKWDFIIVHESGHEWFANNITSKDIADMWVHEGFTNYSETLFTEFYYGKEAGNEYNVGSRRTIRNDKPIIGHYGVNEEGSGDMYAKAGSMIHNIRHAMNNDSLFRSILIGLNKDFYHQTVTTQQIENYISNKSGIDFSKVFDQYLRTIQIPVFTIKYDQAEQILTYQWKNCVAGFNMPLHFNYQDKHFEFLPADYQPQKRFIKLNQFDLKAFAEEIKKQYYVEVVMEQ